jgi:hypothetical protein
MVHSVETTPKAAVPPLETYAKVINLAVETITSYLTSESIPQPSFDPKAPSVTIPTTAPIAIQDARQQLIASAAAIQKLATEPAEFLPNLAVHVRASSSFSPSPCGRSAYILKFWSGLVIDRPPVCYLLDLYRLNLPIRRWLLTPS